MTAHFIQYIDIDRYKCFSDFSAHGFQRVNLIAGKNNVGKTALMEAMFINACSATIGNLFNSLLFSYLSRKKTDYAYKTLDKKDASNNILKQANALKTETNIHAIELKLNDLELSRKFETTINNSNINITEGDMDVFSIIKKINQSKNMLDCEFS